MLFPINFTPIYFPCPHERRCLKLLIFIQTCNFFHSFCFISKLNTLLKLLCRLSVLILQSRERGPKDFSIYLCASFQILIFLFLEPQLSSTEQKYISLCVLSSAGNAATKLHSSQGRELML